MVLQRSSVTRRAEGHATYGTRVFRFATRSISQQSLTQGWKHHISDVVGYSRFCQLMNISEYKNNLQYLRTIISFSFETFISVLTSL